MNPRPRSSKKNARQDLAMLGERLNKFLAAATGLSRRAAEELIAQGRVEIDGKAVADLGARVDPTRELVTLDGEKLRKPEGKLAIVLNKPVGYLCTAHDPEGRPLVYHLVPQDLGLHTVGRLDFNTEGVIVLTTDGDLAERLGHARYSVQRVYEARVRGIPSEETLAKLRRGVRLDDGPARAESAEVVAQTEKNAWVRLVLVEGRNREVRRLMERVGHPVMRLRRVAFAGLTAKGLKPGEWRPLTDAEIVQLQARGHVGSFELPPDPRRKGQLVRSKRITRQAISQREPGQADDGKRAADRAPGKKAPGQKAPAKSPRAHGKAQPTSASNKQRRLTGKPSHDWRPPEDPAQRKPRRPRPEAVERTTDGRRRSTVRDGGGRSPSR